MKTHFIALLLLLPVIASAQFGVAGYYNNNQATTDFQGSRLAGDFNDGVEVALNYWFRLPKKRVEFLPTVYYSDAGGAIDYSEIGLQFKTNLYFFDFATDCDCPTFGKQGPQLQKGLFLQLSPGVAYHRYSGAIDGQFTSRNNLSPSLAGAIGLDVGLSSLITLTPIAGIRYSTMPEVTLQYELQDGPLTIQDANVRLITIQLGLQLTFRLDKKRY